jgi:hypothetical protein
MEINVSCLISSIDPRELSTSVAESGRDAGKNSWAAAMSAAAESPLLTDLQRDEAREYFKGFGAWEDNEIAAWSQSEVDALVLQYCAGDLRILQDLAPGDGVGGIDWDEAESLSNAGTCSGYLYPHNGELFAYIGD